MFYDNLNQACKDNGLTVTALLKKMDMATANGTFWKNGSFPKADVVIQISKLLNVSTDFLLLGKKTEKKTSSELSDEEQELITIFKNVSEREKGELLGYARRMIETAAPETKESVS